MHPSPFFNDISTIADGGDFKIQRTCLIDHQNTVSVYTDAMNVRVLTTYTKRITGEYSSHMKIGHFDPLPVGSKWLLLGGTL